MLINLKDFKIRKFIPSVSYFRKVNRKYFLSRYLRYLLNAKGAHGIHSAFVFDLYNTVLRKSHDYYEFSAIEEQRTRLLYSSGVIEVTDFGAGGPGTKKEQVSSIAKRSSVSPKIGRMLFRLVNYMQPKNVVEMGTSLGLSTLYIAKACPEAKVITMEGSIQKANIAKSNFEAMGISNVKQVNGDFKETLPAVITELNAVDLVFFDGNHRKDATLEYFQAFASKASDNAVFIFDDIRWSQGMYEAWEEIIKDKRLTVTIDLFSVGLCFFRKGQIKEHFTLKF
jgi:predicted O-methyltransferase YrrM